MLNTDIKVQIDKFDGPLALLLYLVQKEEMSVQDFDLTEITGQYLDYLDRMKKLDFDVAGEYLYMASTLLYLKSLRSCNDEEARKLIDDNFEIQSQEELALKLQELQKFQKISEALWMLPKKNYDDFVRPKIDKKTHFPVTFKSMDSSVLVNLMMDQLIREKRKFKVIAKDKFSIKEKLKSLKNLLIVGKKFLFKDLLGKGEKKVHTVVMTFISLLELARLRKLELFQAQDVSEIHVNVKKDISELDINQADGFDDAPIEAPVQPSEPTIAPQVLQ